MSELDSDDRAAVVFDTIEGEIKRQLNEALATQHTSEAALANALGQHLAGYMLDPELLEAVVNESSQFSTTEEVQQYVREKYASRFECNRENDYRDIGAFHRVIDDCGVPTAPEVRAAIIQGFLACFRDIRDIMENELENMEDDLDDMDCEADE